MRPPHVTRLLLAGALGLVVLAGPTAAAPAFADDATASWSLAPSTADGTPDGRTRFDVELAPTQSVSDQVLLANASTVDRTFTVYAADAFNTPEGGYDLGAAAVQPTDVGTWVSIPARTVTVPALTTVVVPFTVTVPDGATPGDHPGGIVASVVRDQAATDGVIVDSRVAVRLNVRVPGDLVPALTVRSVSASYTPSWVPFAAAPAVVTYEITNTGNVKIVGKPRVRITGPFGVTLASIASDDTREILPGKSFTVTATLDGVEPLLVDRAVVDVDMVAAPGVQTEIPLVTSTASGMFLAASWTGLLVVVLLVLAAWFAVRTVRRRRREGEQLWQQMLEQAREAGAAAGPAGAPGTTALGTVLVVAAVLGFGGLALAPGVAPATPVLAEDAGTGGLSLSVPAAPPAASPTPSASSSGSAGGSSSGAGQTTTTRTGGSTKPPGGGQRVLVPTDEEPAGAAADATPSPAPQPTPTYAAVTTDLTWVGGRHLSPAQWGLVVLAAAGALGALAYLVVRFLLPARRPSGAVA